MSKLILCLALLAGTVNAATYYVSPSGAWANDGSSGSPWNHPNRSNYSPFTGGDTLICAEGEYDSVLIWGQDGSASNPTIYKPTNGIADRGKVIWHGGIAVANSWTNVSGNIYYASTTVGTAGNRWKNTQEDAGRSNIVGYQRISGTIDSLLIPMSTSSLSAAGQMYHDYANSRIYVWCYGGGSPGTKIRVSAHPVIVMDWSTKEYNYFIGLDLRGGWQATVVLGDGGNDLTGAGGSGGGDYNKFLHCNIGIAVETNANNPAGIYHGNTYGAAKSSWSQYCEVVSCSLTQVRGYNGGGGLHAGFGIELYASDHWTIDSNVFLATGGGVGLKMGLYDDYGFTADSIQIRYNKIDCAKISSEGESATGVWVGNKNKWTQIVGNIIANTNIAINFLVSLNTDPMEGKFRVWNNTLANCAESMIQFSSHNVTGGNSFQYNIVVDTISAPATSYMSFRPTSDGTNLTENPSTERYWSDTTGGAIDYNMYYTGGETFSCLFMSTSGYTGTNWTSWQAHFDANSTVSTDPQLNNTTYAPSNATAMNVTHNGRTWTQYGAIQPDEGEPPATPVRIRARFR